MVQVSGVHLSLSDQRSVIKWYPQIFYSYFLKLYNHIKLSVHVTVFHPTHIINSIQTVWECKRLDTDWCLMCLPGLQVISIHDSDLLNAPLPFPFNRFQSHIESVGKSRHHSMFQRNFNHMHSSGVVTVWLIICPRPSWNPIRINSGVGAWLLIVPNSKFKLDVHSIVMMMSMRLWSISSKQWGDKSPNVTLQRGRSHPSVQCIMKFIHSHF